MSTASRFDKLGAALRLLRRRDGRKQRQLAEAAGMTPMMLSGYEKATRVPTLESLGRVLDALGLPLASLDEALDIVNDRIPGPPVQPVTRAPRPSEASSGEKLVEAVKGQDLEIGRALLEIDRGLARLRRRLR